MFDISLSIAAIANAAVEILTGKVAQENLSGYNADFIEHETTEEPRKRVFSENMARKTTRELSVMNSQRIQQKISKVKTDKQPETGSDPLTKWIMDHDEMILDCLEPGKHMIENEYLKDVDIDVLIEFLFSQNSIESVEKVKEGLEVISR